MVQDLLREFNQTSRDFLLKRTEESANNIQRTLQILGASSDSSVFDSNDNAFVEFLINLHQLMEEMYDSRNFSWLAVTVLLECCRNPGTRECLVKTFKFVPILTKILVSQQCLDKRLKILQLLQELTYGIKITWQEAHLTVLISTLTRWIAGNEENLLPLSLGVLVNLCYNNLPSVYTLLRTVDIKKFSKILLKTQKRSEQICIQVTKLLIIIDNINGDLPTQEIHTYVYSTCRNLSEALQEGNVFMMRHIVNFFKEVINNPKTNQSLLNFPNLQQDMECLLSLAKDDNQLNQDCLKMLFEFFTCMITTMKGIDFEILYPSLSSFALRWCRTPIVSTDALLLLSSITSQLFSVQEIDRDSPQRQEVIQNVFEIIENQLPVIFLFIEVPEGSHSTDKFTRQTALLCLLANLLNVPKFTQQIITSLTHDSMRELFLPLKKPDSRTSNFFQPPVYKFYLQALLFLVELSDKETSWLLLYSELLQERSVQMVLSIALYTGSQEVKKTVLSLIKTTAFSSQCLNLLACNMAEINKLIVFSPENGIREREEDTGHLNISKIDLAPALTVTQEGYLDSILEKYEKSNKKNDVAMTSSINELYQFKIAAMNQTIRQMQASQEACDKRALSLQHSQVLASTEVSRLHNLLHEASQKLETYSTETSKLRSHVATIESDAKETHSKYTQAVQTLKSKTRIISELNTSIKDLEMSVANLKKQSAEQLDEAHKEIAEMKNSHAELEGHLKNLKKESEQKSNKMETLKTEILSQAALIKKKDDEINELTLIKDSISKLLAGRK